MQESAVFGGKTSPREVRREDTHMRDEDECVRVRTKPHRKKTIFAMKLC